VCVAVANDLRPVFKIPPMLDTTSSQPPALSYRPDIDGLRAVAVLSVLVFHAFPTLLPGGFVGVDLFFVISGYLITRLVWRDWRAGRFSLGHFYAQRVRRIFPALLTVLLFCLAVGWVALTAGEYRQLGKHVAGGAAFVNNILFWREAGYFDAEAEVKPLLHLWSLAIEEQFYLFWPLLLGALFWAASRVSGWLGLRTHGGRALDVGGCVGLCVLLLWVLSLGYSLHLIGSDAVADFYSLSSRAWELLTGAALALWPRLGGGRRRATLWALLGAVALLLSLGVIDAARAFPGAWALLPVTAAAALIAAGAQPETNNFATRLLRAKPLVWVGLISYPLYLWHWPLLSLARIFEGQTPSAALRAALLALAVALAHATYRWIERPVRQPRAGGAQPRVLLWGLCLAMLGLVFVGHGINRADGLKFRHLGRLNADASSIVIGADRGLLQRECGLEAAHMPDFEWCLQQNKTTPPRFAVLGDSKAEAAYYGLAREAAAHDNGLLMGSLSVVAAPGSASWQRAQTALAALERQRAIEWVLLANTTPGNLVVNPSTGVRSWGMSSAEIDRTVQAYVVAIDRLSRSGKRVALLIDNPTLPDPNSCITGDLTPFEWLNHVFYRKANPYCRLSYRDHLVGTADYQSMLQKLAQVRPHVLIFNPLPLLCDVAADLCTYHEGRQFLYSYGNHISDHASSKIARALLPLLKASRAGQSSAANPATFVASRRRAGFSWTAATQS
jgi:peptidoglycan/LPS O-acetylase OafA/YrhL